MRTSNRINWIVVLIGIWEIVAPFVLGYWTYGAAMWNAIIVGALFVIFGAWSAITSNAGMARALDWINFLLGLWLVAAPFVLVYYALPAAFWNAIAVGAVVALLELGAAISVRTVTPTETNM